MIHYVFVQDVLRDCIMMIWRMGAQVLRKKGEICQCPVSLVVFVSSSLMSRVGMGE